MIKLVVLLCLILHTINLSAIAQEDSVKTKNKADHYLRLDDKIILSASRLGLNRELSFNKSLSGQERSAGFGSESSGGYYVLQYAKLKFTYSRLKSYDNSNYVTVNANANTFALSYGVSKFYFAFKYESYYRSMEAREYYSDLSTLRFEEPSLRIKYSPFKTMYVDQLTSANYIQKKTAATIYVEATPYQRTFFTSDTLVLIEDFTTWPELIDARKITQRGSIVKIGLEGNLVIKKILYLAAGLQGGFNPCTSNKLTFSGFNSNWSAADFVYSYSFGAGLNFKFPLFLKFSYDNDVIKYSAPTYVIIDNRKTAYFTLGYRFNEPGFLKRTREKIVAKTKSIFK